MSSRFLPFFSWTFFCVFHLAINHFFLVFETTWGKMISKKNKLFITDETSHCEKKLHKFCLYHFMHFEIGIMMLNIFCWKKVNKKNEWSCFVIESLWLQLLLFHSISNNFASIFYLSINFGCFVPLWHSTTGLVYVWIEYSWWQSLWQNENCLELTPF